MRRINELWPCPRFRLTVALLPLVCVLLIAWVPGPPPVRRFDGALITLTPVRHRLAVEAVIKNSGGDTLDLDRGGVDGWQLWVMDSAGNRMSVQPTTGATFSATLAPGASLKKLFPLAAYSKGKRPCCLYVYVTRWIASKNGTAVITSPILKMTLRNNAPPKWKTVPFVPKPERHLPAHVLVPPFPPHVLPATGPITALEEISKAVHTGNLRHVKQLCYHGSAAPPPFIVALAQEAVAVHRYCLALHKRFGADPEKQMAGSLTTPESFSSFLAELNLKTATIQGDRASVGTLWFNGKKFVPMPNFVFRFRRIGGHWLLDSRATYEGVLTKRQYRLNVENCQKNADVFNSLAREIGTGRYATLAAAEKAAGKRLAAVGDWFMMQSMNSDKR